MATASFVTKFLSRGVAKTTWTLTSSATIGRRATLASLPDKTVHVRGTFAGATIMIFGSNQLASTTATLLTATGPLNDTRGEGNPLTFTAQNTVAILENPNIIWPKITTLSTGAGTKSIIVEIVAQSMRR